MPEIRVDPLSGQRTIVATDRAARPGALPAVSAPEPIDRERDPFVEGHEDRTPPELYALRPGGGAPDGPGWTVRVVPNRFPALDPASPEPPPQANPDLFSAFAANGAHELIVNSPAPVASLAALSSEQLSTAVDVWRERMRAHADCAYTQVIVNEGREAGASMAHTHAQLFALGFVPQLVARERERAGAYAVRTMGRDLLSDLVAEEVRMAERIVAIDDEAVLMAPYASRVPYHLQLAPRVPRMRFEEDGPSGAALLHDGLRRLAACLGASPPLNLCVRTAPRGAEHFCWRIDVFPRLTPMAGLELSTGLDVNVVAPEEAARLLRGA